MTHTIDASGNFHHITAAGAAIKGGYLRELTWVSDQSAAMAADNDFLASDENGVRMFGKRAEFAGDDFKKGPYNPGILITELVITTMDSGYVDITVTPSKE